MNDGKIKYETWRTFSIRLDFMASKSAILELALHDCSIFNAELLFKVADVFREINTEIQLIKDEFNDLSTIH